MTHSNNAGDGRTLTRCGSILREMVELLNDLIAAHAGAVPKEAAAPKPVSPQVAAVKIEEEIERALDDGIGMRPPGLAPPSPVPSSRAPEPEPPALEAKGKSVPADVRAPGQAPSSLFLVCEGDAGRNLAIPWNWVVDTHLSESGAPEAFTLSDGDEEQRVKVNLVLGIWTGEELQGWQEKVRWLSSLQALREPTADSGVSAQLPIMDDVVIPPLPSAPVPDPLSPPPSLTATLARPRGDQPVWIVSPSALARRFLMRHLVQAGLNVREARGLDDPDLVADLERAGALFLDEGLRDQWRAHPTAGAIDLPIVQLTVDGALRIPPNGSAAELGAMLPRPFERSEVGAVVAWLRSLWKGDEAGGSDHHGDAQDHAWLYADPFGSADARKRPGS